MRDAVTNSFLPIVRSKISKDKDALKFLRDLGVPEWDIVDEVIKHILPKYRTNTSTIPEEDYDKDFSKIVSAYKTDSQKKKDQLRNDLMITPIIRVSTSQTNVRSYLDPKQLCLGTDGELWSDNSGTYSCVSVSEEVCNFLRTLDLPQWDIVDEVVNTILPKYKKDFPTVSIQDHKTDFKKIISAYEAGEQVRKKHLKTELQATPFILAENPDLNYLFYLNPDQLYFGTDELRVYFEENDLMSWVKIWRKNNGDDLTYLRKCFKSDESGGPTGAFVDLGIYPSSAQSLFADLGISDSVEVYRKEKHPRGHVPIVSRPRNHKRGLEGFDPNIQVDGLEFALNHSTVEKSAFIWNHIVIPNADCIKGTIESSTRQDYWHKSSEEVVSDFFW